MATRAYELTLSGLSSHQGTIAFADLGKLATPLQSLSSAVARQLGTGGSGRSSMWIEGAARLTLTSLSPGSTVLHFELGDRDVLDLDEGIDARIADNFEDVLTGLGQNQPPAWTGPDIRAAAAKTARALKAIRAGRLSLTSAARELWAIPPSSLDDEVWRPAVAIRQDTSASGELFAVDMHKRIFRITDDLGTDITLENVEGADEAVRFISQRVIATGTAELDANGRLRKLVSARVSLFEIPATWRQPEPSRPLQSVRGVAGGIPDLTDDEIEEFLASL